MAVTAPKEPCQKTVGPFDFALVINLDSPVCPSTYKVVLTASIGIKNILNRAAEAEAAIVLTGVGILTCSNMAKAPVFAAVSPNLETGP